MSSHTPAYNLKAVIRETGLKPDTLRAWERRYGLPQPQRTAGGHRLYSQRDIDMLKWLIARQHEGLSISRAVDMWQALELEGKDPLKMTEQSLLQVALPSPLLASGDVVAELRQAWLSACLAYDERSAEQALAQAFAIYPPETVCVEVLQKGLAYMGEGWYQDEVTVQQEHFALALAMRRLEALVATTPAPTRSGRILAGCPPDEEHTFSLLLLTLLLRRRGWEVLYLGANVPLSQLESTLTTARPQLVVASAQWLPAAATLQEMARVLDRERVPLAYGGMIFNAVPKLRSHISGHFLGERLDMAPQVVQQALAAPWPLPKVETVSETYRQALAHFRERLPSIDAQVWDAMTSEDISRTHLSIAGIDIGRNIAAALGLGDIELMSSDIKWVKGFLISHHLPTDPLDRYLQAYHSAAQALLDKRGQLVVSWLAQVSHVEAQVY